jgi:hypothetical protein
MMYIWTVCFITVYLVGLSWKKLLISYLYYLFCVK